MTLNQIIENLRTISTSHSLVKYFLFGEIYNFLHQDDKVKHCSVVLDVDSAGFSGENSGGTEVSFTMYVMDWGTPDQNITQELYSDTLQIAHDIVAKMKDRSLYDWNLPQGFKLTAFNESQDDNLTGWQMTFSIGVDHEYDRCAVP